mgnify:CR=1 FL=1
MSCSTCLAELLYFYQQRRVGRAPRTWAQYQATLRRFDRYLQRPAMVADLTESTVVGFLAHVAESSCLGTVATKRAHLLALWTWAAKKHYTDEWPDLPLVKVPQRIPTAWTVEQVTRLLDACRGMLGLCAGLPAGFFWRSLILVLFDTGLRATAAWSLRQAEVDLAERTMYVRAETQKHRADQLLRFSPQTGDALAEIWQPARALLFPWDRSQRTRYLEFDRLLQRAGLPHGPRDKFQRIRRTTATLGRHYGAAQGFDATAQLGHSSDAITRRHYLAPMFSIQAADVLPRP